MGLRGVRAPVIEMSVQPFTRRFPLHPVRSLAELSQVREDFTAWLATVTDSGELVEDLSVVISELGANAVHGSPRGAEPATVRAWMDGSVLTLEVSNHVGQDDEAEIDWDLEDPLRTGGRGLLLVSAFVDDIEVDVEDDLLLVRCITTL